MHVEQCWHSGRGPELQQVHYDQGGVVLKAIEYTNPDWCNQDEDLWHLLFIKTQVFMFTLEEVENSGSSPANWVETGKAALVSLGRSPWLASFNPYHLDRCSHFRAMFYDQFLDVICEEVEARRGRYRNPSHG
jgi:hypothetical protein